MELGCNHYYVKNHQVYFLVRDWRPTTFLHCHRVRKERSDGDGITIYGAAHIWVDHCSLSNCFDGLIDVVHGSTAVTISNNYMTRHNKVMLFGHSDSYEGDKNMQATIAFNHFGEGLGGRMPRFVN